MRNALPVLCFLMLLTFLAQHAPAAGGAMAFPDAPRTEGWELIAITMSLPSSGGVLWVQDARGGPAIGRPVDGGGNEERRILMPLPLVAMESLAPGRWPVRVWLENGGPPKAPQVLIVEHPADAKATGPSFRIVISADAAQRAAIDADTFANLSPNARSERGPVLARAGDDDILSGPPMLFAGADAVFLDDHLATQMTAERAAALMACGPELLYAGPTRPGGGLAGFMWDPAGPGLWVSPLEHRSLGPPRPIEPGLARVPPLVPQPPRVLVRTVLLVMPATLVLVLAARAFISRPTVLLGVLGAVLVGGTFALVAALQGQSPPATRSVTWTTRAAPGELAVSETLAQRAGLFRDTQVLTVSDPVPPMPLVASPREYFLMPATQLLLDAGAAGGMNRLARLTADLRPREPRSFLARGVARAYPLFGTPADWGPRTAEHKIDLNRGWWLEDGYVRPAGEGGGGTRVDRKVFTQWIHDQPPDQRLALRAWYDLRCQVPHRYHLSLGEGALMLVDLGMPEPSTGPATQTAPAALGRAQGP